MRVSRSIRRLFRPAKLVPRIISISQSLKHQEILSLSLKAMLSKRFWISQFLPRTLQVQTSRRLVRLESGAQSGSRWSGTKRENQMQNREFANWTCAMSPWRISPSRINCRCIAGKSTASRTGPFAVGPHIACVAASSLDLYDPRAYPR